MLQYRCWSCSIGTAAGVLVLELEGRCCSIGAAVLVLQLEGRDRVEAGVLVLELQYWYWSWKVGIG